MFNFVFSHGDNKISINIDEKEIYILKTTTEIIKDYLHLEPYIIRCLNNILRRRVKTIITVEPSIYIHIYNYKVFYKWKKLYKLLCKNGLSKEEAYLFLNELSLPINIRSTGISAYIQMLALIEIALKTNDILFLLMPPLMASSEEKIYQKLEQHPTKSAIIFKCDSRFCNMEIYKYQCFSQELSKKYT